MSKRATKSIGKILSAILIILLLAGVIGGAFYFIRKQNVDTAKFYLLIENEKVANYANLPVNEVIVVNTIFEPEYFIDEQMTYTIKVLSVSPADKSFDYKLNGIYNGFLSDEDYTQFFNIAVFDDYFTISTISCNVFEMLSKKNEGSLVTDIDELDENFGYFKVLVTASDGSQISLFMPGIIKNFVAVNDIEISGGEVII